MNKQNHTIIFQQGLTYGLLALEGYCAPLKSARRERVKMSMAKLLLLHFATYVSKWDSKKKVEQWCHSVFGIAESNGDLNHTRCSNCREFHLGMVLSSYKHHHMLQWEDISSEITRRTAFIIILWELNGIQRNASLIECNLCDQIIHTFMNGIGQFSDKYI